MRRKQVIFFIAIGLLTGSFSYAEATSISGVSTFTTGSQNMTGMSVTVNFATGSSSSYTWANLDPDSSGVSDSGWMFTNDAYSATTDNTYWNYWTLSTSVGITSITIDGLIADVLFDIWPSGLGVGTTDSAYGKANMADGWTYTVADKIKLDSDLGTGVGDLWGSITLTYGDQVNGFTGVGDNAATFQIDTDKTLASEVPEPATMTLFGLGMLGLGALRRKKIFNA